MKNNFKKQIYKLCSSIPKGKVATYGQLARLAGHPKAARAVGTFMRCNPNAPIVPCHRVVASDGSLAGYSAPGGIAKKKKILTTEGIIFENNKVDLFAYRWKK